MAQPEQLKNIEIRNQVFLEGYKNGRAREFAAVIVGIGRDTGREILDLSVERMNQLTKKELNELTVSLRSIAGQSMNDQIVELTSDLERLSDQQARFEVKAIESVTQGATVATPTSGAAYSFARNQPIRATGNFIAKFFSNMAKNEQDQLANVVQIGYSDGLTLSQMVSRIRGTRVANYSDGYTQQGRRRVEAEVRTVVQHVSQRSREETWNKNSGIIEKYEWVSTLDSRTSDQCRSLDGKRFIVGQGAVPPIHIGCRSSTAPILDESLDFLDEGATRATQDGPVDSNETYYSWLKNQPASFQDSAIGPTRGKLLRNGGLTSDEFARLNLNRNFEPLTLAEMESKAPEVFERAGVEV